MYILPCRRISPRKSVAQTCREHTGEERSSTLIGTDVGIDQFRHVARELRFEEFAEMFDTSRELFVGFTRHGLGRCLSRRGIGKIGGFQGWIVIVIILFTFIFTISGRCRSGGSQRQRCPRRTLRLSEILSTSTINRWCRWMNVDQWTMNWKCNWIRWTRGVRRLFLRRNFRAIVAFIEDTWWNNHRDRSTTGHFHKIWNWERESSFLRSTDSKRNSRDDEVENCIHQQGKEIIREMDVRRRGKRRRRRRRSGFYIIYIEKEFVVVVVGSIENNSDDDREEEKECQKRKRRTRKKIARLFFSNDFTSTYIDIPSWACFSSARTRQLLWRER